MERLKPVLSHCLGSLRIVSSLANIQNYFVLHHRGIGGKAKGTLPSV